jgi:hypothetical protein
MTAKGVTVTAPANGRMRRDGGRFSNYLRSFRMPTEASLPDNKPPNSVQTLLTELTKYGFSIAYRLNVDPKHVEDVVQDAAAALVKSGELNDAPISDEALDQLKRKGLVLVRDGVYSAKKEGKNIRSLDDAAEQNQEIRFGLYIDPFATENSGLRPRYKLYYESAKRAQRFFEEYAGCAWHKDAIWLKYVEGLNQTQIAIKLREKYQNPKITLESVRVAMHRFDKRLAEVLGPEAMKTIISKYRTGRRKGGRPPKTVGKP